MGNADSALLDGLLARTILRRRAEMIVLCLLLILGLLGPPIATRLGRAAGSGRQQPAAETHAEESRPSKSAQSEPMIDRDGLLQILGVALTLVGLLPWRDHARAGERLVCLSHIVLMELEAASTANPRLSADATEQLRSLSPEIMGNS